MNIGFIGLGIMGAPVTAWPMGNNLTLEGRTGADGKFQDGATASGSGLTAVARVERTSHSKISPRMQKAQPPTGQAAHDHHPTCESP